METSKTLTGAFIFALLAVVIACPFIAQNAWAMDGMLAPGEPQAGTLQAQSGTDRFVSPDGAVRVERIKSGSVSYDADTRTLTLDNVKARKVMLQDSGKLNLVLVGKNKAKVNRDDRTSGSLTVKGPGKLIGSIHIGGNLNIEGGDIVASVTGKHHAYSIYCSNFKMSGGHVYAKAIAGYNSAYGVYCKDFELSGGAIAAKALKEGAGIECQGNVQISGGKLVATATGDLGSRENGNMNWLRRGEGISCFWGDFTLTGGRVCVCGVENYSEYENGQEETSSGPALVAKKLTVNGGKLAVTRCIGNGIGCEQMVIKKGTVLVNGQRKGRSIYVDGGLLKMTGGTLKVTKSQGDAIRVIDEQFDENTDYYIDFGGKAIFSGGKVVAEVVNPEKNYAIYAKKLSYDDKCLKSIAGLVS